VTTRITKLDETGEPVGESMYADVAFDPAPGTTRRGGFYLPEPSYDVDCTEVMRAALTEGGYPQLAELISSVWYDYDGRSHLKIFTRPMPELTADEKVAWRRADDIAIEYARRAEPA
jgi:hypothetical protein